MNLSVADLKDTAKKDAVKNGLLDAARENSITILNSTVNSFMIRMNIQSSTISSLEILISLHSFK